MKSGRNRAENRDKERERQELSKKERKIECHAQKHKILDIYKVTYNNVESNMYINTYKIFTLLYTLKEEQIKYE